MNLLRATSKVTIDEGELEIESAAASVTEEDTGSGEGVTLRDNEKWVTFRSRLLGRAGESAIHLLINDLKVS